MSYFVHFRSDMSVCFLWDRHCDVSFFHYDGCGLIFSASHDSLSSFLNCVSPRYIIPTSTLLSRFHFCVVGRYFFLQPFCFAMSYTYCAQIYALFSLCSPPLHCQPRAGPALSPRPRGALVCLHNRWLGYFLGDTCFPIITCHLHHCVA